MPTQIFDLISQNIPAPKQLKTVLVGGSALPNQYWEQMVLLKWPLLKTFGMTETAAFIGTNSKSGTYYDPLPNVEIKLDANERLAIKTDSLFDGYIQEIGTHWQFQPIELHDAGKIPAWAAPITNCAINSKPNPHATPMPIVAIDQATANRLSATRVPRRSENQPLGT